MPGLRDFLKYLPLRRVVGATVSASTILYVACGTTEPDELKLTMQVAPARVACQGFIPQECLRVRTPPSSEWTLFYDNIEGFDYQPGFIYTISVARRTLEAPPSDGSSFVYRLLKVVSKNPG